MKLGKEYHLYQRTHNTNKNKMKKVIALLALASLMVACGGKGTTEGTTDSLVVVEEEVVVDTTAAEAPVAEPVVE
jgi:ABC-type glycerol-3-phosphate transport system substrate-binding protein